jgi:hypothetical protein
MERGEGSSGGRAERGEQQEGCDHTRARIHAAIVEQAALLRGSVALVQQAHLRKERGPGHRGPPCAAAEPTRAGGEGALAGCRLRTESPILPKHSSMPRPAVPELGCRFIAMM